MTDIVFILLNLSFCESVVLDDRHAANYFDTGFNLIPKNLQNIFDYFDESKDTIEEAPEVKLERICDESEKTGHIVECPGASKTKFFLALLKY